MSGMYPASNGCAKGVGAKTGGACSVAGCNSNGACDDDDRIVVEVEVVVVVVERQSAGVIT